MKTYLVGGAVRDNLLGLPVNEQDWVVVQSSPAEMIAAGYRQVGADFPVYIHPKSGEEYALARTERKSGSGYHGFKVDFNPEVTLEQDLQRRDLSINSIAQDSGGNLIDPWGGLEDIKAKVLRHVSPAFTEDPLRILRVARFAARFSPLGFKVAPETMQLMQQMVSAGELETLPPERIFVEIRKAFALAKPSIFIQVLRDCGALAVLLPEVEALFGVPQPAKYHPEIDTGVHTLMSLDRVPELVTAADDQAMMVFVVLLHDLGKALTKAEYLPSHHGHEAKGVPLVRAVCQRLKAPKSWQQLAELVCHWHLQCHRVQEMTPKKVLALLERLDVFRQPQRLREFTLACKADSQGRTGFENAAYPQADYLQAASSKVRAVSTEGLSELGDGKAIAAELYRRRLQALTHLD